jgi:sugar phosphate isomerase/epimerase
MQSLLFGAPGAALFGDTDGRRAFERGMIAAIACAGRFGIPNCVFGSPRQRVVPAGMPMEQALDEAARVFAKLGDHALAAGTRIAIEANPAIYGTNFCTTLEDALGFVARVDHPAIVPILDLGAMHVNGAFAAVPAMLPDLAARLNHVHVSEPHLAPAPASDTALAPVLRALGAAGYGKAVSIEMKRPEAGLAEIERALARFVAAQAEVAHA